MNQTKLPAVESRRQMPAALVLSSCVSVYAVCLFVYASGMLALSLAQWNLWLAANSLVILGILFWGFSGMVLETVLAWNLIRKLRAHDYYSAEKSYLRLTNLWRALPVRKGGRLGLAYSNLALTRLLQGKFESAEAPLRESITLLEHDRRLRNHYSMAIAVNNLAVVLAHCGQLEEAERLSKRALGIYQDKTKSTSGAAFPMINLASICLRQGRREQAEQYLDKAQFLLDYNKKPFLILDDSIDYARAACLLNFALLRCEQEKFAQAKELCEEMLDVRYAHLLRTNSLETLSKISKLLIVNGEIKLAERLLEHAYSIACQQPDHQHTTLLLETYAELLTDTGRSDEVADMRQWIRPVLLPSIG